MASSTQRLKALTNKSATGEHQEEFNKQSSSQADDRSLCLLITAQVENELDRVLEHDFAPLSDDLLEMLYSQEGPWGNFYRKITTAVAANLIGSVTLGNLNRIRNIRNAFAHAKIPIKFDTPEVAAVCTELVCINIFDPPEEVDQMPSLSARARFDRVCGQTMLRLARYTGHDPHFKDENGVEKAILRNKLP